MTDDRPLSGLKVFDATQGIAGPHSTMLMALNGAEVNKIEPLGGDWGRYVGKVWGDHCAHSAAFNRGKRSLALDLKSDAGRAIAQKLAFEADIVVEAFRPGVMDRFGLGYEEIKAQNPKVIYCSVTGYGQRGPNRDRKVSDAIMQAFSGMMYMNKDGQGTPRRIGMIAIDVLTGLYAYQAVASALLARFRYDRGAYIDCNLMQASAAFQSAKILEHVLEGGAPTALSAPIGTMPTADNFINVSVVKEEHYVALCEALERPDLITDARFAELPERLSRAEELLEIVHVEFRKKTTAEWQAMLSAAGIMNASISDYGDFLDDAHVAEAEAYALGAQDGMGEIPLVNIPGFPAAVPGSFDATAPHLGEHSRAILTEAGYETADVDQMIADGAVISFA